MNIKSSRINNRIVVFGANGFLGSSIVKRLHKNGSDFVAVVRPSSSLKRLKDLPQSFIQIANEEDWASLVMRLEPEAVVCAHWSGVNKQSRADQITQRENLQNIERIAKAAKDNVSTFVAFGSQAESVPSRNPIKEVFYDMGDTAYGIVKSQLSFLLGQLFEDSSTRFIWARVFSVYGPDDHPDTLFSKLNSAFDQHCDMKIDKPNTLWSFLFEADFSEAICLILNNPELRGVINIANPQLVRIIDVVDAWRHGNGVKTYNPEDVSEPSFFAVTNNLLKAGWSPKVSLEEGIKNIKIASGNL